MSCKNLDRCLLLFASLVLHPCSDESLLWCQQPLWIRSTLIFSVTTLTCCIFPPDCKLLERRDHVSFAYLWVLGAWPLVGTHETVASWLSRSLGRSHSALRSSQRQSGFEPVQSFLPLWLLSKEYSALIMAGICHQCRLSYPCQHRRCFTRSGHLLLASAGVASGSLQEATLSC